VGPNRVKTFDANPDIILDAQANFARNGLSGIKSHHGVLKNRLSIKPDELSLDFYISKAFWASRLNASASDQDIVKIVQAPIFCLEDEIATHDANFLICDIEGGEVELLLHADLSRIKTIIMEVHYAFVGKAATDNMIRKLIMDGFALDLQRSANQILLLQR
jgi:FkbM family methyltransferase